MELFLVSFKTYDMPCPDEAWVEVKAALGRKPHVNAKDFAIARTVGVYENTFSFAVKAATYQDALDIAWTSMSNAWKSSSDGANWHDAKVGTVTIQNFNAQRS